MRIYAVTPIHVDDEELARRQARYDALCPPGVSVHLEDIGSAAPTALDTDHDVRASESLMVEALASTPQGYDAVMPDCVLDPGVEQLAGKLPLPVLGLLRISLGWQVLAGRRIGAVARNRAIADEIAARVDAYGWSSSFTEVDVLDLDVHAIADTRRWADAMGAAVARLEAGGASVVINGCSAVDVTDKDPGSVRVVDPTALTLRLVAAGELG